MCLSTCGFAHIHSLHPRWLQLCSHKEITQLLERHSIAGKALKAVLAHIICGTIPQPLRPSMWRRAHSFCAGFSQPQYNDTAVGVRFQGLLYQAFSHHYKVVTHTLLVGDSHLYSSPVSAGMDIVMPVFLYCCTVRILTVFILILLLFRFFG